MENDSTAVGDMTRAVLMEIMGPVLAYYGTRPNTPSVLKRRFLPECLSGWGIGSHLVNPAQFAKSLQVFDKQRIKPAEF